MRLFCASTATLAIRYQIFEFKGFGPEADTFDSHTAGSSRRSDQCQPQPQPNNARNTAGNKLHIMQGTETLVQNGNLALARRLSP